MFSNGFKNSLLFELESSHKLMSELRCDLTVSGLCSDRQHSLHRLFCHWLILRTSPTHGSSIHPDIPSGCPEE